MRSDRSRLTDVISGEFRKAFTGSTWYAMLLLGIGLSALTVVGSAIEIPDQLDAGIPVDATTATSIRFWFTSLLGSGLFGVVFVAREFGSRSIARSALLSGTRDRLFWGKLIVTAAMGLLYAAVTVGLMFASLPLIEAVSETRPEWSAEATDTVIGVGVVVAVAAPWGAVFGWLIRSSVGAVGAFLALTLIIDEGLFRLAPAIGRFTMQIAMGAVYRDGKEEALSPEWGAVVVVAWLVAGVAASVLVLRRRDFP